jgi:GNAT superfamily N-acetyltransferase
MLFRVQIEIRLCLMPGLGTL